MYIFVVCSMYVTLTFLWEIYLSWILALTLFLVIIPCPQSLHWCCLKFALKFTSLSWIFALTSFQVCFLVLDFGFDIYTSILILLLCLGSLPWYHFKCASLSWILALTLSQVCFLVFDSNIILSILFYPRFWPWCYFKFALKFTSLSWIFVLTSIQVYFLVLNFDFDIYTSILILLSCFGSLS